MDFQTTQVASDGQQIIAVLVGEDGLISGFATDDDGLFEPGSPTATGIEFLSFGGFIRTGDGWYALGRCGPCRPGSRWTSPTVWPVDYQAAYGDEGDWGDDQGRPAPDRAIVRYAGPRATSSMPYPTMPSTRASPRLASGCGSRRDGDLIWLQHEERVEQWPMLLAGCA